jgi:hypothetical protein
MPKSGIKKENVKQITIGSYFYGAGSPVQYNWVKDGYHIWGVGIKTDLLNKYSKLVVKINGKTYKADTEKLREFVVKYNSIYTVQPSGVKLGVFSKDLLTNISKRATGILKEWEKKGWLKSSKKKVVTAPESTPPEILPGQQTLAFN